MYPQKSSYGWLLLSAAILARFWCLVALLKALVLPLLLHMDGGTIGGRYGYRNGQRSWLTCYRCIKLTTKKFPRPISHTQPTKSKIGAHHATYFWKVRGVTNADLLRGLTIFRYWEWKYWWASGAKWSIVENWEVDGGLFVLLFADSFRYVPARTQKLLAGRMGRTPDLWHEGHFGQKVGHMRDHNRGPPGPPVMARSHLGHKGMVTCRQV